MHELAITQSMLSIALEKAEEAQASRIKRINLIFGDLSGVADESVQFYFDTLSKDTIAAGASLSFQRMPLQLRCRVCSRVFSPDGPDWACPGCNGHQTEMISGSECRVDSIEVE